MAIRGFSNYILPDYKSLSMGASNSTNNFMTSGSFSISLTGTWTGTLRLERSLDGENFGTVLDMTTNCQYMVEDPGIAIYRFTVATTGTGTVVIGAGK